VEKTARRQFLAQSAAALAMTSTAGRAKPSDPFAEMTWLNPPAFFERSGDVFRMRPKPATDFWRKTFIDTVADSGHFLYRAVDGRFTFEARVFGSYNAQYDQAGLMVRQNPECWMKCGTEFFEGKRHASVVVTRDFSDWSTFKDLSDTGPVWWRVTREPNALNIFASGDGKAFALVHSAYFPPSESVQVGLMCAAPTGDGFDAEFDGLKLS
jgi:uncharacterized protein